MVEFAVLFRNIGCHVVHSTTQVLNCKTSKQTMEAKGQRSVEWQYCMMNSWYSFPKSISALIERQFRTNQHHLPIFYQRNTGDKFKILISTQLQYNLQNGATMPIRSQPLSYTEPLNNCTKCPKCSSKITPLMTECYICCKNSSNKYTKNSISEFSINLSMHSALFKPICTH